VATALFRGREREFARPHFFRLVANTGGGLCPHVVLDEGRLKFCKRIWIFVFIDVKSGILAWRAIRARFLVNKLK